MINEKKQRFKYILGDYIASNIGWCLFNCLRYWFAGTIMIAQGYYTLADFLLSKNVLLGQLLFPLVMMVIYYLSGYYNQAFMKSRLQEFMTTFYSSILNTIVLFFVALIDDTIEEKMYNYELISLLFGALFIPVYITRNIITNNSIKKIKSGKLYYDTFVVGNGSAAHAFALQMNNSKESMGYKLRGFVNLPGESNVKTAELPVYEFENIKNGCEDLKIEQLIVVPTKYTKAELLNIVNTLYPLELPIKVSSDIYNDVFSKGRLGTMYGEPLLDVSSTNVSASMSNLKRLMDIFFSAIALILLSPFLLAFAILIKLDSKGPIFYLQERIGLHNRPFNIIKFRTMVQNAEMPNEPQLSSKDDPRITKLGKYMRKYRVDELPQFWNVIKGDMSLVGPRPERRYYIEQIINVAPYYSLLHQVRPGITSLGMVKFGYAVNVEEMLKRLKYDLIYLENISILNDTKIILYTIRTVFTGRGL